MDTINYYFNETPSPTDVYVLDQVVAFINSTYPKVGLELNSIIISKQSYVSFSIKLKKEKMPIQKIIKDEYESRINKVKNNINSTLETFNLITKTRHKKYLQPKIKNKIGCVAMFKDQNNGWFSPLQLND